MTTFAALTHYDLRGKGTVYVVCNPHDCQDFSHLLGQRVEVDGAAFTVAAVESFAHGAPWAKGEPIGLLMSK